MGTTKTKKKTFGGHHSAEILELVCPSPIGLRNHRWRNKYLSPRCFLDFELFSNDKLLTSLPHEFSHATHPHPSGLIALILIDSYSTSEATNRPKFYPLVNQPQGLLNSLPQKKNIEAAASGLRSPIENQCGMCWKPPIIQVSLKNGWKLPK